MMNIQLCMHVVKNQIIAQMYFVMLKPHKRIIEGKIKKIHICENNIRITYIIFSKCLTFNASLHPIQMSINAMKRIVVGVLQNFKNALHIPLLLLLLLLAVPKIVIINAL